MKLTIINASTDLGVIVDGSNLGPKLISNHFKNDNRINKTISIEKQNIIKSFIANYLTVARHFGLQMRAIKKTEEF